jgi:hypothetical protein
MYPTLMPPSIPEAPVFKISRPVVGSSEDAQAAEISAQAAMTEDPTIKANEHKVRPVTVPLNMTTSPYAYSLARRPKKMGKAYDEDDGEILEDPVGQ